MNTPTGIKVTLRDPSDAAQLLHAQFATARAHPEMDALLLECARADVAEGSAVRLTALRLEALEKAATPDDISTATAALEEAVTARHQATTRLMTAIHEFLAKGFLLAGASPENADLYASLVPPERLAELKAIALFGAGSLDFTKGPEDAQH